MKKVKSEKKRETPIRRTQLTAVLVFVLVMILALIPGVMAGDPTGAKTLEENPGAPVDYVWVALSKNLVIF